MCLPVFLGITQGMTCSCLKIIAMIPSKGGTENESDENRCLSEKTQEREESDSGTDRR